MSVLNITPSNFSSGRLCISVTIHEEALLQSYIDEYEEIYLQEMLGCELYDLFVADLVGGVPQDAIYLSLYNKFCMDEDACHVQVRSEGMIKMLEKFIYWEYQRDGKVEKSSSGNRVNLIEASREASFTETNIYAVYNEGINSYKAIQWFICENEVNYPTFNGKRKDKTNFL